MKEEDIIYNEEVFELSEKLRAFIIEQDKNAAVTLGALVFMHDGILLKLASGSQKSYESTTALVRNNYKNVWKYLDRVKEDQGWK